MCFCVRSQCPEAASLGISMDMYRYIYNESMAMDISMDALMDISMATPMDISTDIGG